MEAKKKFYITTPIYYPSAKLHIGHAYCTVATDVIARYKRMQGYDVMFLTGTDEHGQKIEEKAKAAGVTPQQFVDNIVLGKGGVKDLWKLMNISNDRFIRTTDDYHVAAIQKIFKKMYENGDIYKGKYTGKYCTPCESFWTESQLVDGKCPDCGGEVKDAEEEAYFFRLSKYAEPVRKLLLEGNFLEPASRVNEMVKNFIDPGLEDLCVSRTSFTWGVPVDFDPGHVVYVWVDALFNYCTALGFMNDKYPDADFEEFWPADVHMVGKEIVRFHSIIWPAMLMSMNMPLPKKIFGHGWLLLGGGKMSKSKGNVVDPLDVINEYGADVLRVYTLFMGDYEKAAPWSESSVKGCKRFLDRIWSLADMLVDGDSYRPEFSSKMHKLIKKVTLDIDGMKFNTAIAAMMTILNDFYAAGSINRAELKDFLIMLYPFAPHIAEEMYQNLNFGGYIHDAKWCSYDEAQCADDEIEIAVQINGKIKERVMVSADAEQAEVLAHVKSLDKIAAELAGKTIVKEIYVKGKLCNIVAK